MTRYGAGSEPEYQAGGISEGGDVPHIPGAGTDNRPIVWRLWWRFVFTPFCYVVDAFPVAEWRGESITMRVDIWAMNHIGPIRFRR